MRRHYDPILHETIKQYAQSMQDAIALYGQDEEHSTEELLTYIGNTGLQIKQFCDDSLLTFTASEKTKNKIINIVEHLKKEGENAHA